MWTNAVLTGHRNDIENSVVLCLIRQRLVPDVYCPYLASKTDRERLLIAFRKLSGCLRRMAAKKKRPNMQRCGINDGKDNMHSCVTDKYC